MIVEYVSLRPNDTFLWQQSEQKAALKIACIVAIPLELIARCFYNIGVWVYNTLCPRAIQPVEIQLPQREPPQLDDSVARAIAAAQILIPLPDPNPHQLFVALGSLKGMGTLYGQATGDGLGLFTKSLTKTEVQPLKREKLEFEHRDDFEKANPRIKHFPKDGWTSVTDQALMIIRAEKENLEDASKPKEQRIAQQFRNWYDHGLNAFSSVEGLAFRPRQMEYREIDPHTRNVITWHTFKDDPHAAAKEIWAYNKLPFHVRPDSSGAIMRTAVIGAMYHNDLAQAVQEAIRYAKITDADPRSIAPAVAVTVAIALLHWRNCMEDIIHHAEEIAVCVLKDEMKKIYWDLDSQDRDNWENITLEYEKELRTCMHAELDALELDTKPGDPFKALGAGFYALRRAKALVNIYRDLPDPKPDNEYLFCTPLQEIIWEGGDANTHAAVAGALVGTYLDSSFIPGRWKYGFEDQDLNVLREAIKHCAEVADRILRK